MKQYLYSKLALVFATLLTGLGLVSCLDSGTETFPLEPGQMESLAEGRWRLASSQLLNPETRAYVADMPTDDALHNIIVVGSDGSLSLESEDGLNSISLDLNAEEGSQSVYINGREYRITSLGKGRMVVETIRIIDGEEYIHRYIFDYLGKNPAPAALPEDPEDIDRNEDTNATSVVSSSESRTIVRGGYTLIVPKGAVPYNSNGENGRVAFSIQPADELPVSLPSGTTLVEGGNVKIEPMGFTFASPLTLNVPLHGFSASDVTLYRYDEATRSWVIVPFSAINADGTASVSVLELGQFVLVKNPATQVSTTGGIHIASRYIEAGYYYYLTLTPTGNTAAASRSIAFTSGGGDLYMAGVPQGTYNAVITREARTATQQAAQNTETYAQVLQVTVTTPLIAGGGGYSTYIGWTELALSAAGWNQGRPAAWGDETVTYGTGKFQATLTWVNLSGNTTDYDLHLTTPSGEVYYSNKRAGSFELDRDIIDALGDAVENIYSINDSFERGTYKVRVHHYGGATGKRFNCRILVNGVVVKSVTGTQDTGYADIYTFVVE